MNNILIISGMALLAAICISGPISLSVMAKEGDANNQDTTIPPTSGVEDDSNNQDTSPGIPPTSGVEDDANSGENTSPRIPTKGDGLNTLDGDKVLSPQ